MNRFYLIIIMKLIAVALLYAVTYTINGSAPVSDETGSKTSLKIDKRILGSLRTRADKFISGVCLISPIHALFPGKFVDTYKNKIMFGWIHVKLETSILSNNDTKDFHVAALDTAQENRNVPFSENKIGLITLKEPADFLSPDAMGELSDTAVTFGMRAAFIGWGAENYLQRQKFNPKNLRLYEIKHDTMGQFVKVMRVRIENIESYEEKYRIDQLYTNMFCAMPITSDIFFTIDDAGGFVYHEGRILGIFNSVKISLENEQTPGYFIDVSKFSDYLETAKNGHTSSVPTRRKTGCVSSIKNPKHCNVLK